MLKRMLAVSMILAGLLCSSNHSVEAYWGNKEIATSNYTVTIGDWIFEWANNETYQEGDLVFYNGIIYERTGNWTSMNKNPEHPGFGAFLWTQV